MCLISSSPAAPGLSILFPSINMGAIEICSSDSRLWNQETTKQCQEVLMELYYQNFLAIQLSHNTFYIIYFGKYNIVIT